MGELDINSLFDRTMPEPNSGCWIWMGAMGSRGYGRLKLGKKKMLAHRASFSIVNGGIPDGLFVLHKCDMPSCINPDHLYAGTNQDNVDDMMRRQRHAGSHGKRRGNRNPNARLTATDVEDIRSLLCSPGILQNDIAAKYGIAASHVTGIKQGKNWK